MKVLSQKEFKLLEQYSSIFDVTEKTIFAYDGNIYSNYQLVPHLLVHEMTHLKQQEKYGLEQWVYNFLASVEFRLKMEVEAYRKQLASIKDRNFRMKIRIASAKTLSSSLYGDIINYEKAYALLK